MGRVGGKVCFLFCFGVCCIIELDALAAKI